jgi:hypothetical protein
MNSSDRGRRRLRLALASAILIAVAACNGAVGGSPGVAARSTSSLGAAFASGTNSPATNDVSPTPSTLPRPSSDASAAPEPGGGTTKGDIPDNAVFLKYHGTNPAFTIQYVEGWQVTPQVDGVVIRDKDSSEAVAIRTAQADIPTVVISSDLSALQAQPGFKLDQKNTVKVGGSTYVHLVYHLPAPPDPVTGKQVPSTVDRYYVPGPNGLAVVSLSTPDGVDNVDAFRQMIESFRWS